MSDIVIAETRAWVGRVVIGLNLCPFAKASRVKGQVRYVVSEATDPEALVTCLIDELNRLAETSNICIETTLLIHPQVLTDFADRAGEMLSRPNTGACATLGRRQVAVGQEPSR